MRSRITGCAYLVEVFVNDLINLVNPLHDY